MGEDVGEKYLGHDFNPNLKNAVKLSWQSKPRVVPDPQNLEFQLAEVVIQPQTGRPEPSLIRLYEPKRFGGVGGI